MNPYATNKALAHIDRVAALGRGENPAPVHLQLILTNRCNHRCSFCAYRLKDYTSSETFDARDEMPTAKARELIGDFAVMGGKAVQFTGGGEPLLHPHFKELVRYAHSLALETGIVTNGSLMDGEARNVLGPCTWVRVSLDAGTPETYAKVRRVSPEQFHRTIENVIALKKSGPFLGLGFVVTKENWREVPLVTDIASSIGVDNLRLSAAFTPEGASYFDGFGEEAAALCKEAAKHPFVTDCFKNRLADLKQGPPDYKRCAYQHFTTYAGADGNLYRCCVVAYNHRGLLGSGRLPEVWASREPFDARGCVRCQFNDRNRTLNDLIDSYPTMHADFV